MVENRRSTRPCNCVLRGIFRLCYNRFRYISEKDKHIPRATLEVGQGKTTRYIWGRKEEEYVADFYLVSRRNLEGLDWDIFRFHYLLGADWRLCCLRLKLDRGTFFHMVYRIEQKLGRLFRDLQPYALYPLDEYFAGVIRRGPTMAENHRHTYDYNPSDLFAEEQRSKRKTITPIRAPLARPKEHQDDDLPGELAA